MPSEYDEIPGIYSETPRPLTSVRRTFRNYRRCLAGTACVLLIISAAILISLVIGSNNDSTTPEADEVLIVSPENQTLNTLLSLTWPRRDEVWYRRRWEPTRMRCPFEPTTSPSLTGLCIQKSKRRAKRVIQNSAELPNHAMVNLERDQSDSSSKYDQGNESHYKEDDEDDPEEGYDDDEYKKHDGSTYPEEDTFNWNREASHVPECSVKNIVEALSKGSHNESTKMDLEEDLCTRGISLKKNSPAFYHQKAFRKTSPKAFEMSRLGFRMDHASKEISKMLKMNREDTTFDSRWLGDLSESPYCDYAKASPRCSKRDIYRSMDGSCNNLKHSNWGAAFTSFRRAMPPDYADGVLQPRRSKNGQELPNARVVSMNVHIYKRVHSESYTFLTMTWGQFVDHDITATAQAQAQNGTSLSCCHEEVLNNRSLSHPECFAIPMPEEDSFFRNKNMTCMEFSRSAPSPRCTFGPREQLNQNSHFLDGSVIYGSSADQMNLLRTHKEGLLKTQITTDGRQLLPPSLNPNDSCNTAQQMKWQQHCFMSGDSRVNEHILLAILHTVLERQHNYVAEELRDMNPQWNDEKLFQESRRIVIAQIQHITYHEFLPSIIGPHLSYGLKLSPTFSGEYWDGYNSNLHPGIANGFAGGAFRFGHSMIQGLVQSIDASGRNVNFQQLRKYFFSPFVLYDPSGIPDFVRGQVSQKSAAVDAYFSSQVTHRLFQTSGNDHGLDLVAINIQRGRDHGIPAYTRWRMMCGLPLVRNFTDLEEDMDRGTLRVIQKIYDDVDDIDLYTGGLAEKPVMDGLVGPTFACIITDQFLRLKNGDRFWYENGQSPNAFTKDQLQELHKTSLARILCDNIIELNSMQRWPLRKFAINNPRLPCSARSIPRMSLAPWEEGEI